jgi:hypothetical protein
MPPAGVRLMRAVIPLFPSKFLPKTCQKPANVLASEPRSRKDQK